MNKIKIHHRGPIQGEISTPPDKSISHRAVIFASLAEGRSVIKNFLAAEDPMRTLEAFRQMGIDIEHDTETNTVVINGKGLNGLTAPSGDIDCGNSGTTMRLMSGLLAAQPFSSTLTGDRFLLKRPMQRVITPLERMGAVIESEEGGLPPLRVKGGGLKPMAYDSAIASAQVKSAILLAGLYCDGETSFTAPVRSRDHTERMLQSAGVELKEVGTAVSVKGIAKLTSQDITVPADFSSAAFFIVAGLLIPGSDILIKNVGINKTRSGLLEILRDMGAGNEHIDIHNERFVSGEKVADIRVKHCRLKGITDIDPETFVSAIDEFPILCVAAALAEGTTRIIGAEELRVKESDRIAAMATELANVGVEVEELPDGIIIKGREKLEPATVNSHGDHRIAMSMLIAGLTADGETTVEDTDCIDTSFPRFTELLDSLIK